MSKPLRKASRCFLFHDNKILINDWGYYLEIPGGQIERAETPEKAVKREIREETGCSVKNLKLLSEIKYDWKKGGYTNPKYQGEKVFLFAAEVKNFGKNDNVDGDAWEGNIKNYLMSLKTFIKKLEQKKYYKNTNPDYIELLLVIARTLDYSI